MNKTKYLNISQLNFRNKTVFGLFTNSVAVFLGYAHTLCVTLLLYYKVVFLDFCWEYKHNNGISLSPDLELKIVSV